MPLLTQRPAKRESYAPQLQLSRLLIYRRDRFMPVPEGLKSNSTNTHLTGACCHPAARMPAALLFWSLAAASARSSLRFEYA